MSNFMIKQIEESLEENYASIPKNVLNAYNTLKKEFEKVEDEIEGERNREIGPNILALLNYLTYIEFKEYRKGLLEADKSTYEFDTALVFQTQQLWESLNYEGASATRLLRSMMIRALEGWKWL